MVFSIRNIYEHYASTLEVHERCFFEVYFKSFITLCTGSIEIVTLAVVIVVDEQVELLFSMVKNNTD